MGGEIIEGEDKLVASRRRILWRMDGDVVLWAFARWCALQVIHLWDTPQVVIDYLRTGDEGLRAVARVVAKGAARSATRSATSPIAREAARDAARSAAWDVWDAAWSADRDATWAATGDRVAAWNAARDAQNAQLERMVAEAHAGQTEWTWDKPEVLRI